MWFFSSDWHLCHANIIKKSRRSFASKEENLLLEMADKQMISYSEILIDSSRIEEMNSTIIENTNAVVKENDSLVILGDFCWSKKGEVVKKYRDRIRCKNLYLIWGNHDNVKIFSPFFKNCYHQYLWTIEGQKIFTSHFPCRSWDRSHYDSWMLYGHVHNKLWFEDNFDVDSEHKARLESVVLNFTKDLNLSETEKHDFLQKILKEIVISRGLKLTLDVGVDNLRSNVPFGTPWSFEEIKQHMLKKREIWFSLH